MDTILSYIAANISECSIREYHAIIVTGPRQHLKLCRYM